MCKADHIHRSIRQHRFHHRLRPGRDRKIYCHGWDRPTDRQSLQGAGFRFHGHPARQAGQHKNVQRLSMERSYMHLRNRGIDDLVDATNRNQTLLDEITSTNRNRPKGPTSWIVYHIGGLYHILGFPDFVWTESLKYQGTIVNGALSWVAIDKVVTFKNNSKLFKDQIYRRISFSFYLNSYHNLISF